MPHSKVLNSVQRGASGERSGGGFNMSASVSGRSWGKWCTRLMGTCFEPLILNVAVVVLLDRRAVVLFLNQLSVYP